MSISRPQRIFRSSSPVRGLTFIALVGLVAAAATAFAIMPRQTAGNAAPLPGAGADQLDAPPAEVAVVDGATLKLRDRVVRLLGVDPPRRGATCQASDGAAFDCAAAATEALAALVWQVPVICRIHGQDELGRSYAVCEASRTELNRAQVAAGWARAEGALPGLKGEEARARAERRGLWASR